MARRNDRPDRVHHRPTGLGVALLALAGLALIFWWVTEVEVHLAIATAVLVAVVIDGVIAHRTIAPIRFDLRSPDEIPAGRESTWTALVEGWTRPITLRPLLSGPPVDLIVDHGRLGSLPWPPLRRGVVPFAAVDARANGPLGLVATGRRHHVVLPLPVHVTPEPVAADVRWPKPRAVAFGGAEGAPIGDDMFRSVRPYQFGDERRRVHWKATAHHGELMVRESDGLGVVRVRMIVDLGPPGPAGELVAGHAVWAAAAMLDRGWSVELVTLDASHEVPRLRTLGRAFGASPILEDPPLIPLPTLSAPVRSAKDARLRLACTANGSPMAGSGWQGATCRVTRDGIEWS
ncbi:DUF58 domain-containing protein [Aquihabitans sp. McL0605]|uniref:DUF58 domain-containing protein n=1 Tax=Aquihabitans sp. McL0605 TaxID=3415671 RepID=UPI003CE7CE8D